MLSLNDCLNNHTHNEVPTTPQGYNSERGAKLMSSQGSALNSTFSKQAIITGRDNLLVNIRQKILAPPSTATSDYKVSSQCRQTMPTPLTSRKKMQASYKKRASAKPTQQMSTTSVEWPATQFTKRLSAEKNQYLDYLS